MFTGSWTDRLSHSTKLPLILEYQLLLNMGLALFQNSATLELHIHDIMEIDN